MDVSQKQKIETQPAQPVSNTRKEGQPSINHESFVMPSEQEPKLHTEVSEAGVEVVTQTPELPKEVEKLGLQASSESAKPNTEPTGVIKLPLTEDQAEDVINTQRHDSAIAEHTEGMYRTNSIYGLAVLVKKIFIKMQERLIGNK
jgi:hypothetical protein